jgi:hypothetical protein
MGRGMGHHTCIFYEILRDEAYRLKAALQILEPTQALHRYMETIINQRECLRTHITSAKAFTAGIRDLRIYEHAEDANILDGTILT